MVGKIGGETMSHLNSSSGGVEPSLYYPGQKRPGEDGGEQKIVFKSFYSASHDPKPFHSNGNIQEPLTWAGTLHLFA